MAAISTAPLYTSQHPGWNYEAMPYSMNELPTPLPARNDKLPWERKEALEKERQMHNVVETQKAYDEAARQKARGGFFNSMAAAVKPRWARLRTTPRPVREAIPSKRDERRFNNKFHFPSYERLLYSSELCKTVSGSQQILGKVYISENFFCFRESRLQPKGGRRQRLLLVIPIDEILSISQSEITSQPDPRYAPEFRILDQWHSKADGLFLFTRDSKVHRFFGFWTQQTFHDTFNVLDRQWRSRPYTSTTPLRAGESASSRSMIPPVHAASPAIATLEPSTFRPDTSLYGSRSLPVSEEPQRFGGSSRSSSFSGKQWNQQNRKMPSQLLMDIRHSNPISRLRRVGSPAPRYGHVLLDSGDINSIQLVPLESYGSSSRSVPQGPEQFGVRSQNRRFRVGHYAPKRHLSQEQRGSWQQWNAHEGGWSQQQPAYHIPTQLANDIKQLDRQRLHHVQEPEYKPSGVPLGHVIDRSYSSQQRQTGFAQRDRLGFQTVQQRLHTQQRGRAIDPQLKDEISHFNLRSLRHVQPTVRQWLPSAADVKMRVPFGFDNPDEQNRKRHHHHSHHHKQARTQQANKGAIQVFQYEEYDIAVPKSYERTQANKLEEQLKQQGMMQQPDRWATSSASRTYEAGTA